VFFRFYPEITVASEKRINFYPFCLDLANECLWKGRQAIKLRPKAFALLNYLLSRPGQLITKEELLNAVWPETFVGEAILKVIIRQLREALGDDPKSPRFIETAHRRGYRFIGQIAQSVHMPADDQQIEAGKSISASPLRAAVAPTGVVGRDEALARMRGWLGKMLDGERQIVFVTGEPGIGKTALVDTFARSIASDRSIRVGRGQCLEQYGSIEAYLPVLEAIGRLCREQGQVVDVLRAHAPMWLLQMPSLVSASDRESLSREVFTATRERMLREMAEALEALTADLPLVLILEDLHWSDYSTLDLISYLARQRQPAQLMIIGTYRPVELVVSGHPLKAVKRELLAKHQCEELPIEYLSEDAVAEYLSVRFPANRFPAQLAGLIHERTGGNPLFMINAVEYLLGEGVIVEQNGGWQLQMEPAEIELGVPENVLHLIEKQIERLDPQEQRVLEAASVVGMECSVEAMTAALAGDALEIEERCEEISRRHQFLSPPQVVVLPDGTITPRFKFNHMLYLDVIYRRIAPTRRAEMHRRISKRGEEIYGERVTEIAPELAVHFAQGRDWGRAVKYYLMAAEYAARRFASYEAAALARRGLELLKLLPETDERIHQEVSLRLILGASLMATKGYAAVEVGSAYLRARELCQRIGDIPNSLEVLWGLWAFHTVRAELGTARAIAEEFLGLGERLPYAGIAMRGHLMMGVTLLHQGEFPLALEHLDKALSVYDHKLHRDDASLYAPNPGVAIRCHAAWTLWFLGHPDEALERIQEALMLARELSEPHGLAHALYFAAFLHHLRREERLAQEHAEAAVAVSSENGLALYEAMATIARGGALTEQGQEQEGVEQMRQGLAAHQATGAELARPHFLALLGEASGRKGQVEEGLRLLDEALGLADRDGEICSPHQAELYRIKGELLLMQAASRDQTRAVAGGGVAVEHEPPEVAQAEGCFCLSIKVAQQQKAKSWELRAVMSLSRLYQKRGKQAEARDLLTQVYERFTEGFDTADLREAKRLLDELS
jgi:DNA-binding winged helix-turn-helix (wHTH) protein/tetratricopeptide (TPR) repeat protein